ncbi:DUF559 domain-containing protein [Blastococcus sp. KM273129]|uniref:DUF559 domain-containing protein n=1 Tax=Blastococcus sp. KM273129 TaxID=2570315 RepID=UPI001F15C9C1|nr:DUF559 domain-containing protein [Blastococcus sp. KM273129]MCF6737591.1 DUF559 domain-containing protein [Blastococcus sp. KM273129]
MPKRTPRSRITGPTTRRAALAAGVSDHGLRHPQLARLSRDTYLPRALTGEPRGRLAAVLLTAPAGAVVSHLSAADLWELEVPLRDRDDVRAHLVVPASSRAESRVDRRLYRVPLADDEVTRHRNFPVTTPARTWRDLAGILEAPALLAVTDQLLAHRCRRADLQGALDRRPSGRGAARARAVLPVGDPRAESPMESVFRWSMHRAGLPAPVLQYRAHTSAGAFIGRLDFAWPDRRVLVEFDGDLHRDRKTFVEDLRRQNRLVAEGWVILRFSSADLLGRPDEVVVEIRRALRRG